MWHQPEALVGAGGANGTRRASAGRSTGSGKRERRSSLVVAAGPEEHDPVMEHLVDESVLVGDAA